MPGRGTRTQTRISDRAEWLRCRRRSPCQTPLAGTTPRRESGRAETCFGSRLIASVASAMARSKSPFLRYAWARPSRLAASSGSSRKASSNSAIARSTSSFVGPDLAAPGAKRRVVWAQSDGLVDVADALCRASARAASTANGRPTHRRLWDRAGPPGRGRLGHAGIPCSTSTLWLGSETPARRWGPARSPCCSQREPARAVAGGAGSHCAGHTARAHRARGESLDRGRRRAASWSPWSVQSWARRAWAWKSLGFLAISLREIIDGLAERHDVMRGEPTLGVSCAATRSKRDRRRRASTMNGGRILRSSQPPAVVARRRRTQ